MAKNEVLPKGWRWVKLGDACEIIVSPVDKKTIDGELPVKLCNYTDVYYNNAIGSEIDFMAATAKSSEIEKFSLIEGDVIITKDSETPDDIGVPAYVKETIDNLLCGYHLAILRPKNQTIGKYVCYALISPRAKYDFYRFANGITRFGLTTKSYQKIRIPFPPLSEQKAIASLLETWDTAIEKTEALIAAKEKRFKWLLKTFTKPAKDWKKSTMSDSFDLGRGRVISKKYIEENKGIYPVFSSQTSNSGELGKINTFDFEGDYITWTTDGANAGEVFFRIGKFNCTNVCGTAKPKDEKEICSCFIAYYLKGKTQKYVSYVGNPKLMNGVFGTIPIRYPSYIQQQGIAHILNTVQQEIVLLRKLSEQYQTQKHGLMQKLLTGKWRLQI